VRCPEDKIKEALPHPDWDVRDTATLYFSSSTNLDSTLMPLAIQAIERYGRTKAFSFTHFLNLLPQTEQTIGWVIAELQRDLQGRPEEGKGKTPCHIPWWPPDLCLGTVGPRWVGGGCACQNRPDRV
jgi:hypothetical protein